MELNNDDSSKPKLVLVSSIWMNIVGFLLIIFDGVILSVTDSSRNFQESLPIGLIGLLAIATGYGYWKEKRWTFYVSAAVAFGIALFASGIHFVFYLLSTIITSILMSIHFRQIEKASK